MQLLSSFLRQLRESRCLSQAQAAGAAGIGRVTLNRWETGAQQPRALDLESLLAALKANEQERQKALSLLDSPQARALIRSITAKVAQQTGTGPMPHGGELLRALRMRRGLSQEEAARQIGVTVRSLRRWEKHEVWPSNTQIQTLCYALEARPEEMAALTAGDLSPCLDTENVSLEEVKEQSHRLHFYTHNWQMDALKELRFLILGARAWPVAAHSRKGRQVLAEIYTYHADYLSISGRFGESGVYCDRALDLPPTDEHPTQIGVMAAIIAARSMVNRGIRPAPQRGLKMLRHWLNAAHWPEYEAWILSDMAAYTAQNGDVESGLQLARQARLVAARSENPHELYNRELDEAQMLLAVDRPRHALRLIQRDRPAPFSDQPAKFKLLEAQAYLCLHEVSVGQDRLQGALQLIQAGGFSHLQRQAQNLALRF